MILMLPILLGLHNSFSLQSLALMIFDLTQQLKNDLSNYPQEANQFYVPPKISPSLKLYTTFSEDIYQLLIKIRTILAENRQNYFSNPSYSFQAFSERQREELNETIKANLVSVAAQINQLREGLAKPSDLRRKTENEHMKAVVLCLYQLLKEIEKTYIQFEEFSLKRKKKIQQTISIDKSGEKGKYQTPIPHPKKQEIDDPELERESSLLILEKISKQKELEQTKKQIESIHDLMASMSSVVLDQELKTSAFMDIGEVGLFHIEKGNRNLIEANMLARTTGKWWSILFLSLAFSLLILDFLKS